MACRILIFEPDPALGASLMPALSGAAREVIWCERPAAAMRVLRRSRVDVVVASASQDASGLASFDAISRLAGNVPLLVSTRAEEIEERLHGLGRGACDYLIRPYGAAELLARIATSMRRAELPHARFVKCGNALLDRETGRLGDGANWTMLTPREGKLFSVLLGFRGARFPSST